MKEHHCCLSNDFYHEHKAMEIASACLANTYVIAAMLQIRSSCSDNANIIK